MRLGEEYISTGGWNPQQTITLTTVSLWLENFNEHFSALDEDLFPPFFRFTEHDLEVHSQVSPALFDVWAAFASEGYRSAVDEWSKQNGKQVEW